MSANLVPSLASNHKDSQKLESTCEVCPREGTDGWDLIDIFIFHKNGHSWPGFAGEPDGGNYGGSDF